MKNQIIEKKFDFQSIKGISSNQLMQHYQLYKNYVQKINQIWSELEQNQFVNPNTTYSPYRALKDAETYALNGVKLHELYFENLGGTKNIPYGKILKKLIQDFGNYENWKTDLLNAGKSARGWVITAYDPIDKKIRNYLCDAHNKGGIWKAYPLLVLDVYEHAYMIDFGIKRDKYLDIFIQNINWEIIENRYNKFLNNPQNDSLPPNKIRVPYGNRGYMY